MYLKILFLNILFLIYHSIIHRTNTKKWKNESLDVFIRYTFLWAKKSQNLKKLIQKGFQTRKIFRKEMSSKLLKQNISSKKQLKSLFCWFIKDLNANGVKKLYLEELQKKPDSDIFRFVNVFKKLTLKCNEYDFFFISRIEKN